MSNILMLKSVIGASQYYKYDTNKMSKQKKGVSESLCSVANDSDISLRIDNSIMTYSFENFFVKFRNLTA